QAMCQIGKAASYQGGTKATDPMLPADLHDTPDPGGRQLGAGKALPATAVDLQIEPRRRYPACFHLGRPRCGDFQRTNLAVATDHVTELAGRIMPTAKAPRGGHGYSFAAPGRVNDRFLDPSYPNPGSGVVRRVPAGMRAAPPGGAA